MSTPADQSPGESERTYPIDAESEAEMARLIDQDKLMTTAMGGLFPERADLSNVSDILDIACGPGGWVHEVAYSYPQVEVVGIDISQTVINYARAHARVRKLENVHFRVMDALKPLDFPNESFDLVNARTIFAFMPPTAWSGLMQECLRLLRPGGVIRLTEIEWGFSNMPAYERYCGLCSRAMQLAGQSFSPNGLHLGITPMLSRILRDAGCQHIDKKAYILDYSAGTDAHGGFRQNHALTFKLIQPFLIKMKVATQEELDGLYEQALDEMQSDEFCGIWFGLTAWGTKPSA